VSAGDDVDDRGRLLVDLPTTGAVRTVGAVAGDLAFRFHLVGIVVPGGNLASGGAGGDASTLAVALDEIADAGALDVVLP
jgi:hypothetical protein